MVLKACFYVGASLFRLCVSSVFGVRAVFDMDTSHVFPQGVLAVIPLLGNMVGAGVSIACVGCEAGLPLCFVPVAVLSGAGSSPSVGIEVLRVGLPLSSCLAPKEKIAEASEACVLTGDLCPTWVGICSSY